MHTYSKTKELKKKTFRRNNRNIKQAISMVVTFISEKMLQKEHFLAKKHCLLGDLLVHFQLLLA